MRDQSQAASARREPGRGRGQGPNAGAPSADLGDLRGQVERLLVEAGRGDMHAFVALHDLLASQVFGLALRMLGESDLAQECTEEVFCDVWRGADRFDPARGSAPTFVLVVAHRRAVDRVRRAQPASQIRERRMRRTEGLLMDDVEQETIQQMDLESRRTRLVTALSSLDEVQREAIGLAYFAAMTHREIAAHLGVPLGTVGSRIRSGLIAMRTSLREEPPAGDLPRATDAPALVAELARAQRAVEAHEQAKGRLAEETGASIEVAAEQLTAGGHVEPRLQTQSSTASTHPQGR